MFREVDHSCKDKQITKKSVGKNGPEKNENEFHISALGKEEPGGGLENCIWLRANEPSISDQVVLEPHTLSSVEISTHELTRQSLTLKNEKKKKFCKKKTQTTRHWKIISLPTK